MPQFTLFCGKEIFQEGVSIERIIENVENYEKHIYIDVSVELSGLSISNLSGIEKLSFMQRKILNLKKNSIEEITLLNATEGDTLEKIRLQKNNIQHIDESTFCYLKENFPALKSINLRQNPLTNKKEIKEWKKNLDLPFKIKLKNKSIRYVESDD